ncbi:hypothetical protein [Dysgonomonas massiliensis]|uniref:hypothetical protein n=1 Tax=Dysgonomonas massiliensis TaxID=2040292 RepID=UPI000C76886B|nr:hypothetical protein [Dysgonomonas massiliensis]
MEKKTLVIVCLVMLVVSYFVYGYKEDQLRERVEKFEEIARQKEIAKQDSLNNLRPMSPSLEAEMESYVNAMSDINLAGYEKLRRLYYLSFTKEGNNNIVTLMTGYGLNRDKVEGYTRLGKNLILYYGNKQGISQNIFDESDILRDLDALDFYAHQLEGRPDTLFYKKKYVIKEQNDSTILQLIN